MAARSDRADSLGLRTGEWQVQTQNAQGSLQWGLLRWEGLLWGSSTQDFWYCANENDYLLLP